MGGPVEKFIEPLGEKLLAKLFPVFKDRNEVKIGMNHFLTHAWITMTLSFLSFLWWPITLLAVLSLLLVAVAEYKDVMNGRLVDVFTRSSGWLWGIMPVIVRAIIS